MRSQPSMYPSQETFPASMNMEMDKVQQTWHEWINFEACTTEVEISPAYGIKSQQTVNGLNYDYTELTSCAQYASGASATEHYMPWHSFISSSQGFTVSSPISSSSSLSSISSSPSCSPNLSSQRFRKFDYVDELPFINPIVDISRPSLPQSPSPPPPIQPISKCLRSGKRSSSMRAVPYEVPCLKTRSPSPVEVIRNATPPRRSLRPRGDQKYRELTPDLAEDGDDAPYTSENDGYGSQSLKRRGAPSLQPQTRILHKIQRDTSSISCPICANDFSRHADVIRHYMSVHYIKSDAEILNDTSSKRLHCLGCTKILSRKDSRERHEAICPVYCAQQGSMPDIIRIVDDSSKQRARGDLQSSNC